jgi:phosphopantetheine--protein transferase-like protein
LTGLAERERAAAQNIEDLSERRHYILRRLFQRLFVKNILAWKGPLSELVIQHQLDTQPQCLDDPRVHLSFSSSGATALACAATQHRVGIDLEKCRPVENVAALAARFFTGKEAAAIAALPLGDQNSAFLRHWTAKEAGLKAIGKGIVSGLNSFVVSIQNQDYRIEKVGKIEIDEAWSVHYGDFLRDHVVAIVHSSLK